ncbi:MAG: AAA family ATPase [bacterium]
MDNSLLQPEEIQEMTGLTENLLAQLDLLLLGRSELHRMVLIGILCRGHILFEGLPGLGKTELVRALGRIMHLDFKRVQFTPDLMPSDILGMYILQESIDGKREMIFQPGPIFSHILLADEINRASPKTQSALLEAMQERSVTMMGTTRPLPDPFFVLASQNPIELEGTYPLPEAQLDRFMFKLIVKDISADVLEEIISTRRRGITPDPSWTMGIKELRQLFSAMERIVLPSHVSRYISHLVSSTHPTSSETTEYVQNYIIYGASPRAAIAIAEAARAHALLSGRPTAGFEDVKAVAASVLNHRLILNYKARIDRIDTMTIIENLLLELDCIELHLPDEVAIR